MKTAMAIGVMLSMAAGPAMAAGTTVETAPAGAVHRVRQQRGVFDLVRRRADVRAVCGGVEPQLVIVDRTPGDVAAAIFTGLWYTPAHLQVVCAAR
jgi:hypothetical protein